MNRSNHWEGLTGPGGVDVPIMAGTSTPPCPVEPSVHTVSDAPLNHLLFLLQYADSAFPNGAFAHSWGLESAVAEGFVTDAASLAAWCRTVLRHQTMPADATAAAGCCRAAAAGDLAEIVAIDQRLSAARAAREVREASTRMGRRLLDSALAVEQHSGGPPTTGPVAAEHTAVIAAPRSRLEGGWSVGEELARLVRGGTAPGNHAAVFGVLAGVAGAAPVEVAAAVLFSALNGLGAAALRLLRISHEDIQRLLSSGRSLLGELAAAAAARDPLRLVATTGWLDIPAMQHETALVRLFAS